MVIEKQIIVNKSIVDAWKVLRDFANPHVFTAQITHSEGKGGSFNGCEYRVRILDIKGAGTTTEKLTEFSDESHTMSYTVEGLPKAVTYASNNWWLTSLEQNKTKVDMKLEMTMKGMKGMIMKPMMKIMLGKMFSTIMADFKNYVEIGKSVEAKKNKFYKNQFS